MAFKERTGRFFGWVGRFCFRWLKRACILIGGITLVAIILVLIAGGLFANYVFVNRDNLPDIRSFVNFDIPQVGIIEDLEGRPIINLAKEYRFVIKPNEITLPIKAAFLSAEDKDFYSHNGVDWDALFFRAAGKNIEYSVEAVLRERKPILVVQQGASTITDQIVGLYYKKHIRIRANQLKKGWWGFLPRQFLTKMEELRLAKWLEEELAQPKHFGSKRKSKEEILARFLSYTYFRKVYGVKAASFFYFGKKVSDLNYGEAALLAGIIKNPGLYAPVLNPPNNLFSQRQLNRRNNVLDLMAENKYLSQEQANKFKEKGLPVPEDRRSYTDAPSVVNDILSELKLTGISVDRLFDGDIKIRSTSNIDIQEIINNACENGVNAYEERHPNYKKGEVQCAAIVLRNIDAAILASVGGRKLFHGKNYQYSDLNRVRRARQAGSAFKPIVYLTAFLNSWTPDDEILDSPFAIPMGYGRGLHWIENYDRKFLGNITLCEALYRSRNAPTARLAMKLGQGYFEESGMKKIIDTAVFLGIKSPFHKAIDHLNRTVYYPTSALGASEVTVIELANAYREIASGISAEPYMIQEIEDKDGKTIFRKTETMMFSEIRPDALDMVRSCLRKVVTQPGGTAYSLTLQNFPVQVAGKTGTTNDLRNAWFGGWTHGSAGITVMVRIDFDDNQELGEGETGARAALPVFKEIIGEIYSRGFIDPPPEFPDYSKDQKIDDH